MPLRLYNTLTKREEDFIPLHAPDVTLYTCGPTVYGRPHIGNYSSFLMADLLRRWLQTSGCNVTHVKNITDVGHLVADRDSGEDKIELQAREEFGSVTHETVLQVARTYEAQYLEDEKALNLLEPSARPRASDYVAQMKEMIEGLLTKGHAYATEDGIYFSVASFPRYGQLSGNVIDQVAAGARVEVNAAKRHPADFALWKFCVGHNEHHVLRWVSPSPSAALPPPMGFPGWHIECSAMSHALLGVPIDLHTGGEDNIFPHHECEIAQSECYLGASPFVRTWLHKRRIDFAGTKMSKSMGNILTLPAVVAEGFHPLDLRYYLLAVHYRTNLAFSWEGLEAARKARRRILSWMEDLKRVHRAGVYSSGADPFPTQALHDFTAAMDSDLNTPGALAAVFTALNHYYAHAPFDAPTHMGFIDVAEKVRYAFGCFEESAEEEVPAEVQRLLTERAAARAAKDFTASDALREKIAEQGYSVKDAKGEQLLSRSGTSCVTT